MAACYKTSLLYRRPRRCWASKTQLHIPVTNFWSKELLVDTCVWKSFPILLLNTRTSLSCIEISVFASGEPVEAHVWWWTGDSSSSKSEDAEFCCNRHSWQWNLSPRVPSILVCLGWVKWRTPAKKVVPASQRILSRLCTTRSSLACQRQNWRLLGTSSRHTAVRRGKLNSEKLKSMHCYLSCTAGNWCERVHGGVWHAWHLLLLVLNHWASYLADGSTFDAGEVTC